MTGNIFSLSPQYIPLDRCRILRIWALLDSGRVKLAQGISNRLPLWNVSMLWFEILLVFVFRYYDNFWKAWAGGWRFLICVAISSCSSRSYPQLSIQDIGFAAIKCSLDTNKYALVYSFCQYYNLTMVS